MTDITQHRARTGTSGQFAVYDAILFFIIIMIASASIYLGASYAVSNMSTISGASVHVRYGVNVQNAVLPSTINRTEYIYNGMTYKLYDHTVEELVQSYLVLNTKQRMGENYDLSELNTSIAKAYYTGVHDRYHFALNAEYDNDIFTSGRLFISNNPSVTDKYDTDMPETKYSAPWSTTAPDITMTAYENITITLYVWLR